MLVRMLINITGSRDLEPWPEIGGTIDVPDHEAASLVANGYAEEATGDTTEAGHGDTSTGGDGDAAAGADGDTETGADGSTTKPRASRGAKRAK